MSTTETVQAALDAAKGVDARIAVELIDLGEMREGPPLENGFLE